LLSLAEAVGGWQPEATFEPRWSGDQAADFRSRWTHTLENLLEEGNAP
jgi:hypothetical protein